MYIDDEEWEREMGRGEKPKETDKDIHFTDENGNEFFIKIRDYKVEVFKNKTEITDVRFYTEELEK